LLIAKKRNIKKRREKVEVVYFHNRACFAPRVTPVAGDGTAHVAAEAWLWLWIMNEESLA